jgi:putative ABC transport system permease protein
MINETLAKMMGTGSPVGAKFSFIGREGQIIGVMKDFHFHSLRTGISPLAMALGSDEYWHYALVRIHPDHASSTLEDMGYLWQKLFPKIPFAFRFMEDDYEGQYRSEARMGKLVNIFAGLAVFIACLGLLGLTSFAVEQRRKEISIRKVLGASAGSVLWMLGKGFVSWVLVANFIAWPIGYFAMRSWLNNFAYRTNLTVPMFLGTALAAFGVAAVVIILQTYRAAAANPVESMRYE